MTFWDSFFMWWSIGWVVVFLASCAHRVLLWLLDRFGPEEPAPIYLGSCLANVHLHRVTSVS